MYPFVRSIILFISIVFFVSCSTEKDKFLNRNYHAMITKYNVSYNGEVAFKKGLEKVESTYNDDFTKVLNIEPFSFYTQENSDVKAKPIGQSEFELAEEKAVKAIQKHSMLLDGEEKNSQIDEAYLLLGKSRYYTKRFTPALEAFEYIVKNYPTASLIYETVVWRAKSNIHTGNVDFGKRTLLRLLTSSRLTPEIRQQAELGVVMAYEKSVDSVAQQIAHIEASLAAVDTGVMASRAAFVLGQLYRNQGDIEASDRAFNQVIQTKKGLYKYKLQSTLELINNHIETYSATAFLEEIDRLIFIKKNKPYLSKLLFQKGLVYEKSNEVALAKSFFTQSILKAKKDVHQKMRAYEQIGDLFYDEKNYKISKSYYDSLIDVSKNKNSKRVIRIQRKSKSLEKIVSTINMAMVNDSLLNIAKMSEADLNLYYGNHIKNIQENEKRQRIKELKALEAQNNLTNIQGARGWYFYNSKARRNGKTKFQNMWKSPKRKTNWSVSALGSMSRVEEEKELVNETVEAQGVTKYDVAFYTSKINREPKFLDSIAKHRNLNYYELGNAYYRQLKEKDLAIEKLEELLAFDPSGDIKTGTYYKLYKIYQDSEEPARADRYAQKLKDEFPDSPFARSIGQTEEEILEEEDEYIKNYEKIYALYLEHSYQKALRQVNRAKVKYIDTDLAPKYDLLHAFIVAKLEGKKSFNELLKEIKLRHPNTEVAKKASDLLNNN